MSNLRFPDLRLSCIYKSCPSFSQQNCSNFEFNVSNSRTTRKVWGKSEISVWTSCTWRSACWKIMGMARIRGVRPLRVSSSLFVEQDRQISTACQTCQYMLFLELGKDRHFPISHYPLDSHSIPMIFPFNAHDFVGEIPISCGDSECRVTHFCSNEDSTSGAWSVPGRNQSRESCRAAICSKVVVWSWWRAMSGLVSWGSVVYNEWYIYILFMYR